MLKLSFEMRDTAQEEMHSENSNMTKSSLGLGISGQA